MRPLRGLCCFWPTPTVRHSAFPRPQQPLVLLIGQFKPQAASPGLDPVFECLQAFKIQHGAAALGCLPHF